MSKELMTRALFVASILMLTVLVGCGDGLPTMKDLNNTNIQRVHSMYRIYMNQNNNQGPKSKEDLVKFLSSDNTAKTLVGRMELDVNNLDQYFVSERDNEPFKIRWELTGIADHAIVFETTGVEGKRLVAFTRPRELESNEYEGYLSGDLKADSPGRDMNQFIQDKAPVGN